MAVTINGTTGIVTPDLGVDGTTLVVDAANDRVGIGQSSPTKKLEVGGGAVSFSPDVAGKHTHEFTTNAANDARYFLRSDTTTKVDIQANGASYFNGGEVLIGTTIDANIKLDVEGSLRAKSAAYVAPTSGVGLELYYATTTLNDTPTAYITSYDRDASAYKKINYDASDHKFRTSGTEKMRLTSTAGLAVVTAGSMPTNAGNETLYVMGEGHNGHGTSNTRSVVSIIGALTSNSNAAGLWIGARTNENTAVIGTRTASGNLAFETYSGGWGERLRITSDGTILAGGQSSSYDGGFVNLELRKDSTTVGGSMTLVNGQSATAGATCQIDCYQNFRAAGRIVFGRENANNWQAAAGGAASFLSFHTNNAGTETERLRIHSGGQLSVGTPSVIGRYTFYNSGSSGSDAPSGGDKGMYVKSDMGPTHVDLTGVDNYTMQISNGAYAGTGISNPQGTITKLLFHGTTYNGWNSYAAICMDNQGASGYRGDFVFIAGGSERLRIKSNGQVNIGAALPSSGPGTFNVKPASGADSYFKIRPASEFDGAITGTGIDIRNSSNGASQHLVLRAQEFRFWCDNADKVRINSEGHYTSGNLTISGRANYGTDTITTYSQVLSDNHANTFFGQNLKLGVSGTSGDHTLRIINQHASIGGAGMLIGGNGSGRQNTINFYAESANQVPTTDVTANAKMTLNTNGQLTTMGEQRIRYHTGSTDNKTSKVTTALGKSGTYSTCTVTITTHSYCSVAYDILVGGYSNAHAHRVGTYYINGNIWGSYTSVSNVGGSVSASGPNYVAAQKARWTFSKSNGFVHPICSVTVASGGDGYINHGDVSIVWS